MRCEFNLEIECNTNKTLEECRKCEEYKKFVEEYSKISLNDFNNLAELNLRSNILLMEHLT